jgi:hypothetical protein
VVLETPLILQPVSGTLTYTAAQWRSLKDFLIAIDGVGTVSALQVNQRAAGANMSVDIAAGQWSVTGSSIANQGTYVSRSTAVTNVAVAAAPGSGTRTDLICAQVKDDQSDGSGLQSQLLLAVTGTVGGGVPAPPVNALPLATIIVPAGKSSIVTTDITDVRRMASAVGAGLNDGMDYCKMRISTTPSITSGTALQIIFDLEDWDLRGGHSTTVSPSAYVIQAAGKYQISGQAAFASNATGYRQALVRVNGTTVICAPQISASATTATYMSFLVDQQLNAGDYVELLMNQASGAGLALSAANGGTFMVVKWQAF